jgi:hypothetical protein
VKHTILLLLCALFLTSTVLIGLAKEGTAEEFSGQNYLPFTVGGSPDRLPSLVVRPNHTSFLDHDGELWITGEVLNETEEYIQLSHIQVEVLDYFGNKVDIIDQYISYEIPPHEKGCFVFYDYVLPPNYGGYQFANITYIGGIREAPILSVSDLEARIERSYFIVNGVVQNNDTQRVRDMEIIGTFYNSSGNVVGCITSYEIDADFLDPGQATRFFVPWSFDAESITHYRVQSMGRLP